MPPSFRFPYDGKPFSEQADIWLPIGFSTEVLKPNRLMELGVGLIGRLKPGVTLQQAQHDVQNPQLFSNNIRIHTPAQCV